MSSNETSAGEAGPGHLKGEHLAQFERGTALAAKHAGDLPRDHHMYEEPVTVLRPEPGR